jgi:hypothetical protein
MNRKWTLALAAGLMVAVFSHSDNVVSAASEPSTGIPSLLIDDQPVPYMKNHQAIMRNNRVYVPIGVFEHPSIQANVWVHPNEEEYTGSLINHKVQLTFDTTRTSFSYSDNETDNHKTTIASWNGSTPFVHDKELMVPLRAIAEKLGIQVKWNNKTSVASLTTDAEYREQLDTVEEWEDLLGEQPIEEDDLSGETLTEPELTAYFADNDLAIADYEIVSRYAAVVLEIDESESSVFTVERRKNGRLGWDISIKSGANDEGFSVHRTNGFVSVAVYDDTLKQEAEYGVVTFYYGKGESKTEKIYFEGKSGFLVKIPDSQVTGTVRLYGKNGSIYEDTFW